MESEKEFVRLQAIESRLIAAWRRADADLDSESSLLRCAELRTIKRRCEIYLGYVPKSEIEEKEETTPTD